ncbi:MAG TPA: hypothetical protein VNT76_10540, partial [Candidatus Binatus sp.]|nr:hypothetical protein [Candidatus Binatus sp.]
MLRNSVVISTACLWLVLASASFAAAPLTKVVVGYAAINGRIAPLWIAEEQGFNAKYGLQAEGVYA